MALILARVRVGNLYKPTGSIKHIGLNRYKTSMSRANQPPPGYDSVTAAGGVDPHHTEIVVYNETAAKPVYMVDATAAPLVKTGP